MTHLVPHLSVKRNLKKRHVRKILRLVSFTSLASPAATAAFSSVQPGRCYTSPCAHRCPGTYRCYVLMMSLWRDNKCGQASGHRSAAPGQQEYWSAHFRSHLCSETSPGRRLLRADRDTPKGRGRVVGGFAGLDYGFTHMPSVAPVCKDKTLWCWLIQNKHMHNMHFIRRNYKKKKKNHTHYSIEGHKSMIII